MWAWIRHLAAQQTTAPELAMFLLLVTIAGILTAGLIYGMIMTLAWASVLKSGHSWRDVMFPNAKRLKEHAAEYALAGFTSLILTLTLAEKDALVDRVLALPASSYIDNPAVARLFPLGRLPSGRDLEGDSFKAEVIRTASSIGGLVRGPLETGRSEGVRAVFLAGAKDILSDGLALRGRLATILTVLCLGMMAVYVAWLSTRRIRALSAATGDGSDLQKEVMGRIVVLGVCLALLLANPLGSPSADLLADSALAAARIAPTPRSRLDSLATRGILQQGAILAAGTTARDDVARRTLAELQDSLAAAKRQLATLAASLETATQANASLTDAMQANARVDGTTSSDLLKLTADVQSLRQRALLLVFGGAFTIRNGTRIVAQDTVLGLHWLAPGSYTVADAAGNGRPVTLQPGESKAFSVVQRSILTR
jgi:hypothetical protein